MSRAEWATTRVAGVVVLLAVVGACSKSIPRRSSGTLVVPADARPARFEGRVPGLAIEAAAYCARTPARGDSPADVRMYVRLTNLTDAELRYTERLRVRGDDRWFSGEWAGFLLGEGAIGARTWFRLREPGPSRIEECVLQLSPETTIVNGTPAPDPFPSY